MGKIDVHGIADQLIDCVDDQGYNYEYHVDLIRYTLGLAYELGYTLGYDDGYDGDY